MEMPRDERLTLEVVLVDLGPTGQPMGMPIASGIYQGMEVTNPSLSLSFSTPLCQFRSSLAYQQIRCLCSQLVVSYKREYQAELPIQLIMSNKFGYLVSA